MPGPFRVSFKENGDIVIIKISGKMWGHPNFEEVLYDPVNEYLDSGVRKFVVDMSGVRYIASVGVGFIYTIYTSIKNDGGRIALCGMNDRVLSVFYVVEIEKNCETFGSCDKAVASMED